MMNAAPSNSAPRPVAWRTFLPLCALLALAALLRGLYLAEIRKAPESALPALDAAANLAWANAQSTGEWTSQPPAPGQDRIASLPHTPYVRPPGYPLWLAGGFKAGAGRFGLRVAQQVLGILGVFLAWWTARRWIGPRTGWFAGLFAAIHWADIYYAGEFLDASLLGLLVAVAFVVAGRAAECIVRRADAGEERHGNGCMAGWAGVLGLAGGMAIAIRPASAVLVHVSWVWLLWIAWRRKTPSLRQAALDSLSRSLRPDCALDERSDVLLASLTPSRGLRLRAAFRKLPAAARLAAPALAGLLAGTLLVVAPIWARNAAKGGFPAPIAVGDTVAALVGTLPEYEGFDDGDIGLGSRLDRTCTYGQLAEVAGTPRARGIVRHFRRQILGIFNSHPQEAGLVLARKLQLFWGPLDVGSSRVVEMDRHASAALRHLPLPTFLLHALAILGAAVWWLTRRKIPLEPGTPDKPAGVVVRAMPLLALAWVAAWTCSHLPFLASGQWRHPLLPALFFLAAWAVEDVLRSAQAKRWREVALWSATLLCLSLMTVQNIGNHVPNGAKWRLDRGLALEAAGHRDAALVAYRTVLMATPGVTDPESGVALGETSLTPRDVRRHQQAAAVACIKLGNAAATRQDLPLALRYFQGAAELEPAKSEALVNAGRVLLLNGRAEEAATWLRDALARDPRALPARYPLAQALFRMGRYDEARSQVDSLLAVLPDHAPALRLRALMNPTVSADASHCPTLLP